LTSPVIRYDTTIKFVGILFNEASGLIENDTFHAPIELALPKVYQLDFTKPIKITLSFQ
jgi:hypothetical protein